MNWLDAEELSDIDEILESTDTPEELKQRFQITDLNSLNWALRKLSFLENSHLEEKKLFNAEIDRIQTWFRKRSQAYELSKNFFEGLIKEYSEAQIKADPKWKGHKTPYGKVNFHKQKDQWEYDEEALVAYLEAERKTALLKVKSEPIKDLIKDYYTLKNGVLINESTGEVVPGVAVIKREPKLSIKLEG